MSEFTKVVETHGTYWVAGDGLTFIAEYPGMNNPNERFARYTAKKPKQAGKPWTCPQNRNVGFFPTIEKAMGAA